MYFAGLLQGSLVADIAATVATATGTFARIGLVESTAGGCMQLTLEGKISGRVWRRLGLAITSSAAGMPLSCELSLLTSCRPGKCRRTSDARNDRHASRLHAAGRNGLACLRMGGRPNLQVGIHQVP